MALFFREDKSYDESRRMVGFDRYRQLLGEYALRWTVINLFTVLGALPLVFGIWVSIASSSIAVLFPASILGGMIFGPFFAGMADSVMRGLRDAPGKWYVHYKKSWKQNWRGSLLPGAVTGLFAGLYSFMLYLFWISQAKISLPTILIALLSAMLFLIVTTLYWPQLVLFDQSIGTRLKNCVLFTIRNSRRVFGIGLLELGYLLLVILFSPWTLILIPFLGIWFVLFVAEFLIYDEMNASFHIEEQFIPIEGDPWAASEP